MSISINSTFDGGNIDCLKCETADDIRLRIQVDAGGEFFQWFYFRMTAPAACTYRLTIENAHASAYPRGWENYNVVASTDRNAWFRCSTVYENGMLSFSVTPDSDVIWFAYFAPYSMQRHESLLARTALAGNTTLESLGNTIDGRSMDLLQIGNPQARLKIWSIARQHPGETMAQWWMEGYLSRLVSHDDAVSRELLEKAVFYVVPNMNPDGSYRGYLRTNAAGANLNREWNVPSAERSPEVLLVRQKMLESGVDFCLDVHGDEALAYNFIAGTEGIKSWNTDRLALQEKFKADLQRINPDFQTVVGYPVAAPGTANYGICSNYVAEQFACPAMTLEMPFKDTIDFPDDSKGWSAERSAKLGSSCVDAIYSLVRDW